MTNLTKKIFFFFIILSVANNLCAQKLVDVRIELSPNIESNKFSIKYDDGINIYTINDSFVNNRLKFKVKFASEYATINIKYTPNNSISYDEDYFIGTKPAGFYFFPIKNNFNADLLKNCKLTNAIAFDSSEWDIKRRKFSRKPIESMNFFVDSIMPFLAKDSATQAFFRNLNKVTKRDIEFVKRNRNLYFSFWWFRKRIVPSTLLIYKDDRNEIQKLLTIFDTVFPKRFTEKPEGQRLRELLAGRLFVKGNTIAPHFEAKDIHGNIVKLKDLKGKYVLLDFWATWCPPCMKQIPFLRQLRKEYSSEKLAMISISADVDSISFNSVIKKNEMNWTHIFDSEVLPKIYGIKAYPTLILINTEGLIIYYDAENQDKKNLIGLLKQM